MKPKRIRCEIFHDECYSEEWKDVFGYEGMYQVSNLGRVRSINRIVAQRGRTKTVYSGHRKSYILKQGVQNNGYSVVWLCKDGKKEAKTVHRIVASAFCKNDAPDIKTDVNHKDGNKQNNCFWNLEWCSKSDNIKHAYKYLKRKPNTTPVRCENTGTVYGSIVEAEWATGIGRASISHVINGRAKTAGGLRWSAQRN